MKKLFAALLSLVLALTLTACGGEKHEVKLGQALTAAHGTKCFTVTTVVVEGETIVAAFIDEFQAQDATKATGVPNAETFTKDGKVLASKRVNNTLYSQNMAKSGSTQELAKSYDAIQAYCVGKTVTELSGGVDTVSGSTLVDTKGYVASVVEAAKAAQASTTVATVEGSLENAKLNVVLGAAHGTKCFTMTAAYVNGGKVVLSYIDEFQYQDATKATGVPNPETFTVDGKVVASKRVNNKLYSENMAKSGSTQELAKSYDAIQAFANGKAASELDGVDTVSGSTLVDTKGYVAEIVKTLK